MIPNVVLVLALVLFASPMSHARAEEDAILVDDFSASVAGKPPVGWRPLQFKKVPRFTEYTVVAEGAEQFVQAFSSASASAIARDMTVSVKEHPMLTWRWKVSRSIGKADAKRKKGDDYAARIYVAFKYDPSKAGLAQRALYAAGKAYYGEYPPQAALNYIWDNKLPVGTVLDNPYTSRVKMIVLQSGDANAGTWITERRNVYEDFKKAFKEEPPPLHFLSIMTDSDNTRESVTAWFDDLVFYKE